jgi:hypothetical protein
MARSILTKARLRALASAAQTPFEYKGGHTTKAVPTYAPVKVAGFTAALANTDKKERCRHSAVAAVLARVNPATETMGVLLGPTGNDVRVLREQGHTAEILGFEQVPQRMLAAQRACAIYKNVVYLAKLRDMADGDFAHINSALLDFCGGHKTVLKDLVDALGAGAWHPHTNSCLVVGMSYGRGDSGNRDRIIKLGKGDHALGVALYFKQRLVKELSATLDFYHKHLALVQVDSYQNIDKTNMVYATFMVMDAASEPWQKAHAERYLKRTHHE